MTRALPWLGIVLALAGSFACGWFFYHAVYVDPLSDLPWSVIFVAFLTAAAGFGLMAAFNPDKEPACPAPLASPPPPTLSADASTSSTNAT